MGVRQFFPMRWVEPLGRGAEMVRIPEYSLRDGQAGGWGAGYVVAEGLGSGGERKPLVGPPALIVARFDRALRSS
jgi:hypothetical protein